MGAFFLHTNIIHYLFMIDGEKTEQGSPKTLLNNPQTIELKKYLIDGN
ncbi:MAG: hypothetical protein JXR68_14385 [Bacteroidales bacterium]|nr:hypothetical protein [Bacteroidales bacterium]